MSLGAKAFNTRSVLHHAAVAQLEEHPVETRRAQVQVLSVARKRESFARSEFVWCLAAHDRDDQGYPESSLTNYCRSCGTGVTANISAFQAEDQGSIPWCRTLLLTVFRGLVRFGVRIVVNR